MPLDSESKNLPIPVEQLFYADDFYNCQKKSIIPLIDYLHYPTLGCPALLGPNQFLQVLLSLPSQENPADASFALVDRHGQMIHLRGAQHARNRLPDTN